MTHVDIQELNKEGTIRRIYGFLNLHSCPPTDNDDPFSLHINYILNNDEFLGALLFNKPDSTNSLENPFLKNLLHLALNDFSFSPEHKDRVLVIIQDHQYPIQVLSLDRYCNS